MSKENLVRVEREDLRLGKPPLNLHGEQGLLNLPVKRAIRGKKQISSQLHGQGGRTLHPATGLNIAVPRPYDAPHVDSRMPKKIFVLGRDQGIPQNFRVVFIRRNYTTLQRERSNNAPLIVIKLGDRTGTVMLEFVDLGQVRRIDKEKSRGGAE